MSEPAFESHPDEMTLDVYIDRELPEVERDRIEAHLRDCPDCREYVQMRRKFFTLIADSEEISLTRDISPQILGTLQRARRRLLVAVLSLETILAGALLALFGSRISSGISIMLRRDLWSDSLFWLGEWLLWITKEVEAGLIEISTAIDLLPLPGFSGLPAFPLNWLHWTGILSGIFFIWLLVNRILIDGAGVQRSRVS
jgi:hypothetical protein